MGNITFDDFSKEETTSIIFFTLDKGIFEWEHGVAKSAFSSQQSAHSLLIQFMGLACYADSRKLMANYD